MRILFVTQIVPYPPHGGVLQRGFNLLRELGREHDVHLCAFVHPDELRTPEEVETSLRELRKFCRQVEYFDLWPKRSAAHRLAAFAAGALYPLPFSVLAQKNGALSRRVRELCDTGAVDVVHLDTIGLAPLRVLCGKVPVVLAHHNIESQLMARRGEHETGAFARWYVGRQAELLRRYERQQAPRFALNITVSPLYFQPLAVEQERAVVYTGGMNMFANRDAVEWFLEAIWPRIRAAVPDAKFHAIGAHPSRKLLEAAAAGIGVDAPGFVKDVRPTVGRSSVYVVPLRVGGGTRLKMVDAMAQGKAIVATSVGAEGIHGDDRTHFVLADEPARFADTVIGLLRDATERQRLGAAARQRAVDRYAWPGLASRLADGYATAIRGEPK
jgi:glycosyltransferase involved in cell wall biosynthesis